MNLEEKIALKFVSFHEVVGLIIFILENNFVFDYKYVVLPVALGTFCFVINSNNNLHD